MVASKISSTGEAVLAMSETEKSASQVVTTLAGTDPKSGGNKASDYESGEKGRPRAEVQPLSNERLETNISSLWRR